MANDPQTTEDADLDWGPSSPPCIKCGETYWGTYTAPFTCEVCESAPWEGDDALRVRLEIAGWRYAILIGITNPEPDEGLPQSMRDGDARKYARFIRHAADGRPLWTNREATTFVSEVTGASREMAAAWLNYDWDGGGEV